MRNITFIMLLMCLICLPGRAASYSPQSVPILLYHAIGNGEEDPLKITAAQFERQMSHLRARGYQPLFFAGLNGWERGKLPRKPVLITMDDGYESQYAAAFPILLREGMKATVFAITGNVGKPDYMSWGQLRKMEASGAVDVQSHSVTHPDFTKLGAGEKAKELAGSRAAIIRFLGHRPIAFAYPYGSYDEAAIEAVRKAGYRYAVTGEPGRAELRQGRLSLHRILITRNFTFDRFRSLFP